MPPPNAQSARQHQPVVVANFGPDNSLWAECKNRSTIVTYEDADLRRFYLAGDRAGYEQLCLSEKLTSSGKPATKNTASTWWGITERFEASANEVWLHRDGDLLWWTVSKPGPFTEVTLTGTALSSNSSMVHVFHKPAQQWSSRSVRGRPLEWAGLHPKARNFLQKGQGTLGYLQPSYARYALALIHDESLDPWHNLPAWQQAESAKKVSPVSYPNVDEFNARHRQEEAARRMVGTALATVLGSNGQVAERVVKDKQCHFATKEAFEAYVLQLLKEQGGRCKLSGLPLQWDHTSSDPEMLASLDRIDSSGHYAKGNLQVVCHFINFWKSDQDNDTFLRLLNEVRTVGQEGR